MLQSLELFGFKSFADRVKFDFSPGITCVVGPNGSGKSNVVDAIKWLLGDQSAKSLRGSEMSDVIFNGSAARGGSGFAEAILTFDNNSGLIPYATREVAVGRRLYRSGESEYLLNGEAVRLKDVRALFLGTGAGSAAYSIIEQGRVGQILQANPAARRAVFEEAAGVSKFKARRAEAERRLARVATNLERLQDIVDDTETRLAATRSQASKAAKYRELTQVLREQWLGLAGDRYRILSERLAEIDAVANDDEATETRLQTEVEEHRQQIAASEADLQTVEHELAVADETLGHTRETLAGLRSTMKAQRQQAAEIEGQLTHSASEARIDAQALIEREADLVRTEAAAQEAASALETLRAEEGDLNKALERLDVDRAEAETEGVRLGEQASELNERRTRLQAAQTAADERCERLRSDSDRIDTERGPLELSLAESVMAVDKAREAAAKVDREQAVVRDRIHDLRARESELKDHLDRTRVAIGRAREEKTAAESRLSVLQDLEPAVGTVVSAREIVERAARSTERPWNTIVGRVGDLLDCAVEHAPLLDLALGQRAHFVVTTDLDAVTNYLAESSIDFDSRVGFVEMSAESTAQRDDDSVWDELNQLFASGATRDLHHERGVIGRADDLVRSGTELAERLLADTWIVERLGDARRLHQTFPSLRFITRIGEVVESDGAVILGQLPVDVALVGRRAELRELRARISHLGRVIRDTTKRLEILESQRAGVRDELRAEESRHPETVERAGQSQSTLSAAIDRLESRRSKLEELEQSYSRHQDDLASTLAERDRVSAEFAEIQAAADHVAEQLKRAEDVIYELSRERAGLEESLRSSTIRAATAKSQLDSATQRLDEVRADVRAVRDRVQRHVTRRQSLEERKREALLALLNTRAARDVFMIESQRQADAVRQLRRARERIRTAVQVVRTDLADLETQYRDVMSRRERSAVERDQAESELDRLRERCDDDFGISLEEAAEAPSAYEAFCDALPEDVQRPEFHEVAESLEQEAQRTRRKIKNLGSVNTESLRDLDELESRFETLSRQLQDLVTAKNTLEGIIARTNTESRRMFSETFDTVRAHFQELFRKCFGGGSADLVLDEAEDILDSGIDIMARPPGKELRNLSLLSGGEKAMTAVALLMALFRAKPSPYCILDEVDAPLDEANIDRFLNVLREFRDETQFVIITHRRRTMTSADVIYGVTMETSGISKRLAVNLEEVADDGSVKAAA